MHVHICGTTGLSATLLDTGEYERAVCITAVAVVVALLAEPAYLLLQCKMHQRAIMGTEIAATLLKCGVTALGVAAGRSVEASPGF